MAKWPYNTARWQRLRKRKLAKSPMCECCFADGEIVAAREVDHKQPISKGGEPWAMDNLQSLCTSCHSRKTMQYDQHGKDFNAYINRGVDEHGNPRDPAHPWHPRGDQSLQAEGQGPPSQTPTELVLRAKTKWASEGQAHGPK